MSGPHMYSTHRDQKNVLDVLGLELQMALNHAVIAGKPIQGLWKGNQYF